MQIYFAGPLFTPYERDFLAHAAVWIRAVLLDGPMIDDGTACEIGSFSGMKIQGDDTQKGVICLVATLKRWQAELA